MKRVMVSVFIDSDRRPDIPVYGSKEERVVSQDEDTGRESREIEGKFEELGRHLGISFSLKFFCPDYGNAQDFARSRADVYVFDTGGLGAGYGCASLMEDTLLRSLVKMIEGMPNRMFVPWSSFTSQNYRRLIESEFPELSGSPNVVRMPTCQGWGVDGADVLTEFMRKWFGLDGQGGAR